MSPTQPTWTQARLSRVMRLAFGTGTHHRPDTAAAAAVLGRSPRTIQRWLHGPNARTVAHIPAKQLDRLLEQITPSAEQVKAEHREAKHARRSIGGLHLGRKAGIRSYWEKQRWLEQHLVVVLAIKVEHDLEIRQLAITRAEVAKTDALKKRGTIIDQVVVPTRFHATLVREQVLTDVGPWRFRARDDQVLQGATQAWLPDAPTTNLPATFHTISEQLGDQR